LTVEAKVIVDTGRSASQDPAIHDDLGMQGIKNEANTESEWLVKEQTLFHDVLGKQRFDILVVPFQVQDFALDHNERSLMTQQLVRRIRATTDLSVADPLIVERALGWGSRTYPVQRIYKLANLLQVKTLVRMYAGHGRDMKMRLTAVVQDLPESGTFDTTANGREIVLKDLPFSDERLPSDVFMEMLPGLMSDLRIKENRKSDPATVSGLNKASFPTTPKDVVQSKEISPLIRAAHLAIFGSFSPSRSRTSQEFFVRSLALLQDVKGGSPDAVFLKAYALTNLYRRPAALAVLKEPSTPEQRALRSYLDGDLAALPALVERIRNPIPRMLMLIELNDMRWVYDSQTAAALVSDLLKNLPAGWELFGKRRLTQPDVWNIPNTFELKKFLDEVAPINKYTLQDIAQGMIVRGEFITSDTVKIDVSIQEHRARILPDRSWATFDALSNFVTELDLLDLTSAWAEQTMLKSVGLRVYVQALYEEGIGLADKYETTFRGHPDLSAYKVQALQWLAGQKQGDERKNINRALSVLARDACIWFQGQYPLASSICWTKAGLYDSDFPRRAFWRHLSNEANYGDRTGYKLQEIVVTSAKRLSPNVPIYANFPIGELSLHELDLRYSETDFHTLQRYYQTLYGSSLYPEADMLITRNMGRFNGSPNKIKFLVDYFEKRGDDQKALQQCEDSIPVIPGVWTPYYELGMLYLKRGSTLKAKETFDRYSLFRSADRSDEARTVNTVALSNYAYEAGNAMHRTGAFQEARPFLELSAGYQTGSGSGMLSEYKLAMYEGNYRQAAESALTRGRRYERTNAYADYLRLLRIVWKSPDVDSLFFNLNMMDHSVIHWDPILTSLRMDGKDDNAVRLWLSENSKKKIKREQAESYYLKAFLVDRGPDSSLADRIENIEKHVPTIDTGQPLAVVHNSRRVEIPSLRGLFATSRNALVLKQYDKATALFDPWMDGPFLILRGDGRALMPMLAWSGAKVGRKDAVEKTLKWYTGERGRDFESWLATAMIQAAGRDHENALKSLDLARANINSSLSETRFVPAWYQLVEMCELLFEDTQVDAYRDRVLELARMYQKVDPLESWAYAVEAKYAKTEDERIRPLAITLYLDPRSFHVSTIPGQEKERALKWFKKNNPFTTAEPPPKREASNPAPLRELAAL